MRNPFSFHLIIILFAVVVITACGTTPPRPVAEEAPAADLKPIYEINKIENEITVARQNQIDILSPDMFAKAENSSLKAKNEAEKGSDISLVTEYTGTARQYLHAAEENAKVARTVLEPVIESRSKARIAGATKLEEDYREVEDQFLILTQAIEKNNIDYAKKNSPEVDKDFRDLELRAIKVETIGKVRDILKKAKEDTITRYAPESFDQAKKLLKETNAYISQNPYAKEEIYKMARNSLSMAKRALVISDQCKAIESMTPEEIAFYIEDTLSLITGQLKAPDMRDQKFYVQVDNIKGSISSLQENNRFLNEKLKSTQRETEAAKADCEKRLDALNQRIAFLEGKTQEEQAANEQLLAEQRATEQKLAAGRRFNQLFTEVQNFFDANEAEIYKKGNQLVIRLKGIRFPVGQAIIMPDNYMLLSKVRHAIRTFGEPSVVIEGHTDSTGTPQLNKHLSQQRAESVRQYLIANQTLPEKKLIAVGYGPERPLASNATPEGRAINRRIDLIIMPDPQPEK